MEVDQLVEVDLLVLPGSVELLPLSQHGVDLLPDLGLGGVVLTQHGLAQRYHLAERFLAGLNLRLEIVVLRFEQLSRGGVGDFLLRDEAPPQSRGPGQQVSHHAKEGVVVIAGQQGSLSLRHLQDDSYQTL